MDNVRLSPLISEEQISAKVSEIGAILTDKYAGKTPIVIGVLKGSFMFFADLIRAVKTDLAIDFCAVSSYINGMHSVGEVSVTMDLTRSIKGRHVILVEDIVDTGLTMNFLKRHLQQRHPKSLECAALLLKPDALKEKCDINYVGFEIPNDFVVGYGLDYQGFFRNLPYIAQVSNIN